MPLRAIKGPQSLARVMFFLTTAFLKAFRIEGNKSRTCKVITFFIPQIAFVCISTVSECIVPVSCSKYSQLDIAMFSDTSYCSAHGVIEHASGLKNWSSLQCGSDCLTKNHLHLRLTEHVCIHKTAFSSGGKWHFH
jgi:hypothetical protein